MCLSVPSMLSKKIHLMLIFHYVAGGRNDKMPSSWEEKTDLFFPLLRTSWLWNLFLSGALLLLRLLAVSFSGVYGWGREDLVGDGSVKSWTFQRSSHSVRIRAIILVLGQERARQWCCPGKEGGWLWSQCRPPTSGSSGEWLTRCSPALCLLSRCTVLQIEHSCPPKFPSSKSLTQCDCIRRWGSLGGN